MTWLIGQLWVLMLLAFVLGGLVAWGVVALTLPKVEDLEEQTGTEAKGLWS